MRGDVTESQLYNVAFGDREVVPVYITAPSLPLRCIRGISPRGGESSALVLI
jgi:hypothetical protein